MNAPGDITRVAVRELCEFTAKEGDLDLRFTPAPSALQGVAGHNAVAARRAGDYRREIALESRYANLHLRGRADGLQADAPRLEEIKTHRGDLSRLPRNHRTLHWAQLKIYGAQLCAQQGLRELDLALVYYDIDQQRETVIEERHSAESLLAFHDRHCERYLSWDVQQRAHRLLRDAALGAMVFPHADFHAGQRQLAEAVYRACTRREVLMAQAPTGIGKSIGTLFPALKAMARQQIDKIFFLTAKTSGRQSALDALSALKPASGALPLRVLEMVAREKCCVHLDKACHGESCPLARGFYDRLPAAREAAVQHPQLHQAQVRSVAAAHQVCPYYLSQDLVRWADVVVGDYNYYFDQSALLHNLTAVNQWQVAVLVDEAHNLVERARAMYSAQLDPRQLSALRRVAPKPLLRVLTQAQTAWAQLAREQQDDYLIAPAPPALLVDALRKATAAIGDYFAEHPVALLPELQRFYFDALNFLGLADVFGPHSLCDITLQTSTRGTALALVGLRNIVPAPFIAKRVEDAACVVTFSATFNPPHFYRDLLGLPAAAAWVDVPSPFSATQVQLQVAAHISTRYPDRADSARPIADLMAAQFERAPGNYLAFFSSYDYLDLVAEAFATRHGHVPWWAQSRGMSEPERSAFLARFSHQSAGIGFAVLGGAFAEGIDLPGRRLIGAFVATLGLPQINPFNEEMRLRMEQLFGAGYDYTYLIPGLQKVVQAAGRVIRTREDRGVIVLIDERYAQAAVRRLLPTWWTATAPQADRN